MGQREALKGAGVGVLEARDLEVTPPGATHPAVRGVSLRVGPGEWVGLVGENGGGKSTLLHALAGLWPISGGSLTLGGGAFGPGLGEAPSGSIAVVLQDPSSQILQPTVAEELAFAARNLGRAEDEVAREVDRWARALGLESELALDPATLSAGRQQVVLLAAALTARPLMLFADEPTAHLDGESRARVRALIETLVAGGLAVVWATQDPQETAASTRTLELGTPGRAVPEAEMHGPPGGPGADGAPRVLKLAVSPGAAPAGPRIRVRHPLAIEVQARGVTALVGPNGAGKSVLLSAVAGLETVAQVSVAWESRPAQPPSMALQYPELQVFEDLVADEIVFAAVARGVGRDAALAQAANMLRTLDFDPQAMLARRTWTLSTGEKRLIEVVGALIAPAALVILDEPTGGLDGPRREALGRLVARRSAAVPVMVASQDLEWLERIGARQFALGS